MIGSKTFLAAIVGALLIFAPAAHAEREITLDDGVKANLLNAEPLQDRGVTRETFNGKPLLVIYFASW